MELCCREPPPGYPVIIPVSIRGHPPPSSQTQSLPPQSQHQQLSATLSGTSVTPTLAGGYSEEQLSKILGRRASKARIPSASEAGILAGTTTY